MPSFWQLCLEAARRARGISELVLSAESGETTCDTTSSFLSLLAMHLLLLVRHLLLEAMHLFLDTSSF